MSLERVFVIGAGLMGHGIAQVSAAAGKQVTLSDRTASSPRRDARIAANLEPPGREGQARAGGRGRRLARVATAEGTPRPPADTTS